MTEPLFESIDEGEYTKALATPETTKVRTKAKYNLADRTRVAWFKLPTSLGVCTVPTHGDVQDTLTDQEKQYRTGISLRMVFPIDEFMVCRDCYIVEADKL